MLGGGLVGGRGGEGEGEEDLEGTKGEETAGGEEKEGLQLQPMR